MPDWSDDLLAGVDRPRPLPDALRRRLAAALLEAPGSSLAPGAAGAAGAGGAPADGGHGAERPLGDDLTARLADELGDPVAALMAGLDGPRPLRPAASGALARALGRSRRPVAPVVGGIAAALVVLAGIGIGIGVMGSTSPHARSSALRAGGSASTGSTGTVVRTPDTGPSVVAPGAASGASPALAPTALGPTGAQSDMAQAATPAVTAVTPDTGPVAGGTWVTVTGSGFDAATAVRFGSTPAVGFLVLSGTELRAEVPPHAPAVVDVVVVGPGGSSALGPADRYSYTS